MISFQVLDGGHVLPSLLSRTAWGQIGHKLLFSAKRSIKGWAPSMSGMYLLWTESIRAAKPVPGAEFRSTLKVHGEASPLAGPFS